MIALQQTNLRRLLAYASVAHRAGNRRFQARADFRQNCS
ncbi:MAG TPA: hypothetical protein VFI43_06405 [Nitrosospira sp.]|nr:hypothetical protein [Nitrosospira sp.]